MGSRSLKARSPPSEAVREDVGDWIENHDLSMSTFCLGFASLIPN